MIDTNFIEFAKEEVAKQLRCSPCKVYTVWSCKTLHHIKGLFSSDVTAAKGKYWEFTYNGIKKEVYIDCYVKEQNNAILIDLS